MTEGKYLRFLGSMEQIHLQRMRGIVNAGWGCQTSRGFRVISELGSWKRIPLRRQQRRKKFDVAVRDPDA